VSDTHQSWAPATGGIRALLAKHPTAWLVTALAIVFVVLSTGAVYLGTSLAQRPTAAVAIPTSEPTADAARLIPEGLPPASRLRTCTVGAAAADPLLGNLAASVINVKTGETLFDRGGASPQSPAGALQLVTAAAAITTLGPQATLSTKVLDGTTPGSIVLVGGGDPTLSTTRDSVYVGAPLMSDLATAAMAKYAIAHPGVPVTSIVLDASLWDSEDKWDSSWPTSERTEGYLPFITALMVDGDRADATQLISARGDDPITRAGQAFATAAGLTGVTFSRAPATSTTVLATVTSQPVSKLISQMLMNSDNALAEMLARAISLKQGGGGTSASLQKVIPGALATLGVTGADALIVKDGSGESANNGVPPLFLAQLMVKVSADEKGLGVVLDGLPAGGVSGDLADRFTGDNAVAGEAVRAKSGWIFRERSLAGVLTAADGTLLSFAFYGLGEAITYDTREALDALTTAVHACGNNLSNN
jgi:serine-type D-Ala-D-Ala carboxypeptidase/endopeptidase (penicillin-binding protein 4)